MNKRSLSALIVLNVVLLATLSVMLLSPPAEAQAIGGGGKYLVISGDVQGRTQQAAVYIIDQIRGRMAVILFNTSNNKLEPMATRSVTEDLAAAALPTR